MNRFGWKLFSSFFGVGALLASSCGGPEGDGQAAEDPDAAIMAKVDSVLALMTLEEKAGQMLNLGLAALLEGPFYTFRDTLVFDQAKLDSLLGVYGAGSVQNLASFPMTPEQWQATIAYLQQYVRDNTRLGIPLLYGIDAVHGANYTAGAVMTPQQINLAATFNPEMARQAGQITAYELRACRIPWNYSPVLDVARHPLWGRMFESFGEDSYLTARMGVAMIQGMQGDDLAGPTGVLACAKHFIGYGASYNGKDRSPVVMPEHMMRETLLPPFKAAIDAGLLSLMVSSGSMNGVPSHIDKHLLTDLLKGELGFKGVVISDWNDIDNLHKIHRVAADEREAVKLSVLAGLDMCMEPYDASFAEHVVELVNAGELPLARIDDAVRRILYVKFKLGLFEDPMMEGQEYPKFSSDEFDGMALAAAIESMTLLKNKDSILPFSGQETVLLTGVGAHSLNYLNGGWSRTWSGQDTAYNDTDKMTLLEALRAEMGDDKVLYSPGSTYDELLDVEDALRQARQADRVVVCLGERPATEKPSDIDELEFPEAQLRLVRELAKAGKPIVLVLLEARPRIFREVEPLADAVLLAYLPGNEGGRAIAQTLVGKANPSGRLPYTYPRFSGSLWTYDHSLSDERDVNFGLDGFQPQYPFGHGLSYTSFAYEDLRLDSDSIAHGDTLWVSLRVRNAGQRAGKDAVLMFLTDEVASLSPPVKRLRHFEKVELAPGESRDLRWPILPSDLEFINTDNQSVWEPGLFTVSIGDLKASFYLKKNN